MNEVKLFFANLKDPYSISCRTLCDNIKINYSEIAREIGVSHTTILDAVNYGKGSQIIKKKLVNRINQVLEKNKVDIKYLPSHFWNTVN